MGPIRFLSILTLALALGRSARAQSADCVVPPPWGLPGASWSPRAPGPGIPKATLWDNGPYITQFDVGASGADVSEVEPSLITFGLGHQFSLGNRVADDFQVQSGQTWNLSALRWVAYQTGAPTSGTITGIYTEYTQGSPNGPVIAGDTNTNQLVSSTWTGVYRVSSSTLTNTQRALIEVTAAIPAGLSALGPGNYWLRVMCDGTLASGPWAPVTVPWDANDNGHQELGLGNGFQPNTAGIGSAPADHVFRLDGSDGGIFVGPSVYCTALTNSCGAQPVIAGPSLMADPFAGSGSYPVTCGIVPGGPLVAILIYTSNGSLPNPASGPFGFLCITPGPGLIRVPISYTLLAPGGCVGSYVFNFGGYLFDNPLGDPSLVPGITLDLQAWYRDPASPGAARLSNAMSLGLGTPPPAPSSITFSPNAGGEGTLLAVNGQGFDSNPANLGVLLADGFGFADVSASTPVSLSATVFAVGQVHQGPITVVHGVGTTLPNNVVTLVLTSTASQIRMILGGVSTSSAASYGLAPASNNTVSQTFGTPLPGQISLPMAGLSGDQMDIQLAFRQGTTTQIFKLHVDFSAIPGDAERAAHVAAQLDENFGDQGLSATAAGTSVRITMAGSTYGGIVVKGS